MDLEKLNFIKDDLVKDIKELAERVRQDNKSITSLEKHVADNLARLL